MNKRMWSHPATQENIAKLRDYGYQIIGPGKGYLACGEEGVGRMSEPEEIVERIVAILQGCRPKNISK